MRNNMLINVHESLDKNKVFNTTRPPEIDVSKIDTREDWLAQLERLCCEHNSKLDKPFQKHISDDYRLHNELKSQLKIVYHRLNGDFDRQIGALSDNERNAILAKLTEEIGECTQGFHNRVNAIITSMELPSSLAQLLYKVRLGIVENTTTILTNEVHATNYVTRIAQTLGFGIRANFEGDPYVGNLTEELISSALAGKFESEYTPFNIPILLCDVMRGVLSNFGYDGKKDAEGYTKGEYSMLKKYIERCLVDSETPESDITQETLERFFIIDEETYAVKDIDWVKIRKLFFEALKKENYFTEDPIPTQLWEYTYTEPTEEIIKRARELTKDIKTDQDQKAVFNQLTQLQSHCPDTYNEIRHDETTATQLFYRYHKVIKDNAAKKNEEKIYLSTLMNLKKAQSLFSPLHSSEIIKSCANTIIDALTSPWLFIRLAKKAFNPPSLTLILKVLQILISPPNNQSPELDEQIKKLEPILTGGQYTTNKDDFKTAISIVVKLSEYTKDFKNPALAIFLKKYIKSEADYIKALKLVPKESLILFSEMPGLPHGNTAWGVITYKQKREINFKLPVSNVYRALRKIDTDLQKQFSEDVIKNLNEIWISDESLSMLIDIDRQHPSDEIKRKLQDVEDISWTVFLKTAEKKDLIYFIKLAKLSNAHNLLLTIANSNLDTLNQLMLLAKEAGEAEGFCAILCDILNNNTGKMHERISENRNLLSKLLLYARQSKHAELTKKLLSYINENDMSELSMLIDLCRRYPLDNTETIDEIALKAKNIEQKTWHCFLKKATVNDINNFTGIAKIIDSDNLHFVVAESDAKTILALIHNPRTIADGKNLCLTFLEILNKDITGMKNTLAQNPQLILAMVQLSKICNVPNLTLKLYGIINTISVADWNNFFLFGKSDATQYFNSILDLAENADFEKLRGAISDQITKCNPLFVGQYEMGCILQLFKANSKPWPSLVSAVTLYLIKDKNEFWCRKVTYIYDDQKREQSCPTTICNAGHLFRYAATTEGAALRNSIFYSLFRVKFHVDYTEYCPGVITALNSAKNEFIDMIHAETRQPSNNTSMIVNDIFYLINNFKTFYHVYREDHPGESTDFFLRYVKKCTLDDFFNLSKILNKSNRALIYKTVSAIPLDGTIERLKLKLISALSRYLDSYETHSSGEPRFFCAYATRSLATRLQLKDASKLIDEIKKCGTIESIQLKISESIDYCKDIDTKRRTFLIGKSDYRTCLDECERIAGKPIVAPNTAATQYSTLNR